MNSWNWTLTESQSCSKELFIFKSAKSSTRKRPPGLRHSMEQVQTSTLNRAGKEVIYASTLSLCVSSWRIYLLSLGKRLRGLGEFQFVVRKLEGGEHKIVGLWFLITKTPWLLHSFPSLYSSTEMLRGHRAAHMTSSPRSVTTGMRKHIRVFWQISNLAPFLQILIDLPCHLESSEFLP